MMGTYDRNSWIKIYNTVPVYTEGRGYIEYESHLLYFLEHVDGGGTNKQQQYIPKE